jgi:cell division protein FtsW (lipid II flippase)
MTITRNQTKTDPRYLPVDKAFAPDWILFVLTLLLVSFGVVLVYDASYALAESQDWTGNDPMYYLKRQALFAVVGWCSWAWFRRSRTGNWQRSPMSG